MSSSEVQSLLKRIVLPPDEAAKLQGAKNMPRINSNLGEYYYNNPTKNGKESGDEDGDNEDDDAGKDDDGKSGEDDDPRKDPAKGCPENGDVVGGLKKMHDCNTGRCVNVNFTMLPKPPEGWEEVCKPPADELKDTISYYYSFRVYKAIRVNAIGTPDPKGNYIITKSIKEGRVEREHVVLPDEIGIVMQDIAQFAELMDWKAYYRGEKRSGNLLDKERILNELKSNHRLILDVFAFIFSNKTNEDLGIGKTNSSGLFSGSDQVTDQFIKFDVTGLSLSGRSFSFPKRKLVKYFWNEKTCAEIVSTASGFKPACEEHDPNLPPQLKGENSAIELCDSNGNKVLIERNGKDWKYTTESCTVTVNENGTVTRVQKNS